MCDVEVQRVRGGWRRLEEASVVGRKSGAVGVAKRLKKYVERRAAKVA